jgi:CRP-like cAMP-binding protein
MAIASIDFQMLANAGFPPARYAAGDVIFAEGDKGDAMYVIRNGEVTIEHGAASWKRLAAAASSARWP